MLHGPLTSRVVHFLKLFLWTGGSGLVSFETVVVGAAPSEPEKGTKSITFFQLSQKREEVPKSKLGIPVGSGARAGGDRGRWRNN